MSPERSSDRDKKGKVDRVVERAGDKTRTTEGLEGGLLVHTVRGDIEVKRASGAIELRSVEGYAGEFEAPAFPIRISRTQPGKRFTFAIGNGNAKVDLESFKGAIQLFAPGDRAVLERFRESWREGERERVRENKWIFKGEWLENEHDHDDGEDAEDAEGADDAVGHKRKNK